MTRLFSDWRGRNVRHVSQPRTPAWPHRGPGGAICTARRIGQLATNGESFLVLNELVVLTLLLFLPSIVLAGQLEVSGPVGAELRTFVENPQFPDQFEHFQPSLLMRPEWTYWTESGTDQFQFVPFLRLDGQDDDRTHFDIREAFWRHVGEEWETLIGFNKVFWGVTESRHLVDIINQTDMVENPNEEEKLGQPMISFATQRQWGSVDLFVLTGFRKRTSPGKKGRLRFFVPVEQDDAEFESSAEEWHVDYALRYSHSVGDWDFGTYYFYGTGREPRLRLNQTGSRLIPLYDLIHQVGTDVQYTKGAWLWKFEGIVREGQGSTFAALVGGVEYTLYQLAETSADLGLLLEYLYDGRDEDPTVAPPTVYDDDIFAGIRLVPNDVYDTEVLAGAVVDREHGSTILTVEAARRLGQNWKVEIESSFFSNVDDNDVLVNFKDDSFIMLRLLRFF